MKKLTQTTQLSTALSSRSTQKEYAADAFLRLSAVSYGNDDGPGN